MVDSGKVTGYLSTIGLEVEDLCATPMTKRVLSHQVSAALLDASVAHSGDIPLGRLPGIGAALHSCPTADTGMGEL